MNNTIQIEIDASAGFCYGVKRAIARAEEELGQGDLLSLGEIVHNAEEQNRLTSLGLRTISHDELESAKGSRVLLRAHGEPPATYKMAKDLHLNIIDATCPIVIHLQEKVRNAWQEMREGTGQIVIFGKKDHPETIGLAGQTEGHAIIIQSEENLFGIDFTKPVYLFSQTTMNPAAYRSLADAIKKRFQETGMTDEKMFRFTDSICRHVSRREDLLRQFARRFDLLLFVSGKNSSNGRLLFSYCTQENKNCYLISNPAEIDTSWLEKVNSIGISGATSTPSWLMEDVKKTLEKYFSGQ